MPEPRAVLWDMDGVIVDTAPFHLGAWQYVFGKRGVQFTEEDFRRVFGQRNDTIIRKTLGQGLTAAEVDAVAMDKEQRFRELARGNLKAHPGAIELMKALRAGGFKLAVATSAPPENIQLVMDELDVRSYFDTIVAGREVAEGKPSPQCFLLAAERLGVAPARCIVIEDAVAGVEAAGRAGMRCVAVTNTHPASSLARADLVVDTLEKVSTADMERLLDHN